MTESHASTTFSDPIDAVVTWVDGNDPKHRVKREAALKALEKPSKAREIIPAGKDPTRFIDNGEIRWCLHSIRKFAPWIRHIHLVTDNQVPAFLTPEKQKELGVRIVDHTEIFRDYEWALPTFNTRTIETALWRIDGLTEKFIYFNDDFILIRPVLLADFFPAENVVCRGRWQRLRSYGPLSLSAHTLLNRLLKRFLGITHTLHLLQQSRSAQLAGFRNRFYRIAHVPHPLRRSTLHRFFEKTPSAFESNIRYPFRSIEQFSAVFLAYHLEINGEHTTFEDFLDSGMFSGEYFPKKTARQLISYLEDKPSPFLCLQAFERFEPADQKIICRAFDTLTGAVRLSDSG